VKSFFVLCVVAALAFAGAAGAVEYSEPPEFESRVAEGDLPPVEARLPAEPYVVEPNEEIGQYGGTLRTVSIGTAVGEDYMVFDVMANLVKPSPDGSEIIPNVAEEVSPNEDMTVWTIRLRPGMRWSDGEPVVADNIMFWYEDVLLNEELTPTISADWQAAGEVMDVVAIDEYTVEFRYADSKPGVDHFLVHQGWPSLLMPSHFLKDYHADYVDSDVLDELVADYGYDHWYQLFGHKNSRWGQVPTEPGLPTITAYKMVEKDSSRRIWERNPYFWKVDSEGNQLPYIERIDNEKVAEREMVNGMIMSGDVDFAAFNTDIRNYPLFQEYQESGGYRTELWTSGMGTDVAFMFNQTIENPVLREIFQDNRFRQAMSLAIDRDEINEVIYFGQGVPRQYTVLPTSDYYREEFGSAYAEYDPERAGELLDEMGLDQKDAEGYRLDSEGNRFTFTLEYYDAETPKAPTVELVMEHWREIGIDAQSRQISGELQGERATANLMEATLWHGDKLVDVLFGWGATPLVPDVVTWSSSVWIEWSRWVQTGGEQGEEPPQDIMQLVDWHDGFQSATTDEERRSYAVKILEAQAENVYIIGTVGLSPWVVVADQDLRNLPEDVLWAWDTLWSTTRNPEQFFFDR